MYDAKALLSVSALGHRWHFIFSSLKNRRSNFS